MKAHSVELGMDKGWSRRGALAASPILPVAQTLHHEMIHTVECPIGIARSEIISPAAKHGIQFHNQLLHIFPALPLTGDLSHPGSEFLFHRLRAWSSLDEVPTRVTLDAPLLANRAPQERKALLTPTQSINRVFAGCSVTATRFITSPIRRSGFPG